MSNMFSSDVKASFDVEDLGPVPIPCSAARYKGSEEDASTIDFARKDVMAFALACAKAGDPVPVE